MLLHCTVFSADADQQSSGAVNGFCASFHHVRPGQPHSLCQVGRFPLFVFNMPMEFNSLLCLRDCKQVPCDWLSIMWTGVRSTPPSIHLSLSSSMKSWETLGKLMPNPEDQAAGETVIQLHHSVMGTVWDLKLSQMGGYGINPNAVSSYMSDRDKVFPMFPNTLWS